LYRNDGKGNFTKDLRSTLMGVEYGKIDVADIDNDTDLDLIVTGQELREHREDAAIIYIKTMLGFLQKKQSLKTNTRMCLLQVL
jgi:predicted nucleotidyltransferase